MFRWWIIEINNLRIKLDINVVWFIFLMIILMEIFVKIFINIRWCYKGDFWFIY